MKSSHARSCLRAGVADFTPGEDLDVTRTPPRGFDQVKCEFTAAFVVDGELAHVDAAIDGVLL